MKPEDVRHQWAEKSGEYSPTYYSYRGPDEASEHVRERVDRVFGPAASILEPGCGSGRHLEHLLRCGYHDLHGIEINESAFDVMARDFPELAATGSFVAKPMEAVLPEVPDDRFDVVFSVETLQHVHPQDDRVFTELVRIAKRRLITIEIESPSHDDPDGSVTYIADGLPLYYRDWGQIFTDKGMVEVTSRPVGTATLREFAFPET